MYNPDFGRQSFGMPAIGSLPFGSVQHPIAGGLQPVVIGGRQTAPTILASHNAAALAALGQLNKFVPMGDHQLLFPDAAQQQQQQRPPTWTPQSAGQQVFRRGSAPVSMGTPRRSVEPLAVAPPLQVRRPSEQHPSSPAIPVLATSTVAASGGTRVPSPHEPPSNPQRIAAPFLITRVEENNVTSGVSGGDTEAELETRSENSGSTVALPGVPTPPAPVAPHVPSALSVALAGTSTPLAPPAPLAPPLSIAPLALSGTNGDIVHGGVEEASASLQGTYSSGEACRHQWTSLDDPEVAGDSRRWTLDQQWGPEPRKAVRLEPPEGHPAVDVSVIDADGETEAPVVVEPSDIVSNTSVSKPRVSTRSLRHDAVYGEVGAALTGSSDGQFSEASRSQTQASQRYDEPTAPSQDAACTEENKAASTTMSGKHESMPGGLFGSEKTCVNRAEGVADGEKYEEVHEAEAVPLALQEDIRTPRKKSPLSSSFSINSATNGATQSPSSARSVPNVKSSGAQNRRRSGDRRSNANNSITKSLAASSPAPSVAMSPATISPLVRTPAGKMPHGTGSLFKCAVCAEFVYESQLNFHLTVCVDVDNQHPLETAGALGESPHDMIETPKRSRHAGEDESQSGSVPKLPGTTEGDVRTISVTLGSPDSARSLERPRASSQTTPRERRAASLGRSTRQSAATDQPTASPAVSPERVLRKSLSGPTTPRSVGSVSARHARMVSANSKFGGAVENPHDTTSDTVGSLKRSESMPPLSCQKREWKGWKDSDIERHHIEAAERKKIRKAQLQEELFKREMEECTFTPRVRTAKSPVACGGDPEWLRKQQLRKTRSTERIERDAYSNVTLHPQISRFAQQWSAARNESQREMRDASGGQVVRPPTVFERLYHFAHAPDPEEVEIACTPGTQTTPRSQHQKRVAGDNVGDANGTVGNSGQGSEGRLSSRASTANTQRRSLITNHLYIDAIDRRYRQRTIEMQASEQMNAKAQSARQVLSKSRRYYWQMLERQTKVAFDVATNGESFLGFAQLEDFMTYFGCLKASKASTPLAGERSAEESKRLRASLWQHLDPKKAGRVDLLTLTVFFHVLMGAIDEDSLGLREALSTGTGQDVVAPSPVLFRGGGDENNAVTQRAATLDTSQTHSGMEGGMDLVIGGLGTSEVSRSSSSTLMPITEEFQAGRDADHGGIPCENLNFALDSAFADAGGNQDAQFEEINDAEPENRHICELLSRFDPIKLRSEFRQLYLDRLHHHHLASSNAKAGSAATASVLPSAPTRELDPSTRAMAERVLQREQAASGGAISSHADLMYWQKLQKEAKFEALRDKKAVEELRGCTFHPNTSLSTPRKQSASEKCEDGSAGGSSRTSDIPRHVQLFAKGKQTQQQQDRAALEEQRRDLKELESCTFKPNISKSGRSYTRGRSDCLQPGSHDPPKGFVECKERLRRAFAGHVRRRQLLEDRTTPININSYSISDDLRDGLPLGASSHSGSAPALGLAPPHSEPSPLNAQAPHRFSRAYAEERVLKAAAPASSLSLPVAHRSSAQQSTNTMRSGSIGAGQCADQSQLTSGVTSTTLSRSRSASCSSAAVTAASGRFTGVEKNNAACASSPSLAGIAQPDPGSAADRPQASAAVPAEKRRNDVFQGIEDGGGLAAIVCVEVNIAPGRPPERLALRQGQTAAEAAADFASKHMLAPHLAQRLHRLLQELIAKPEKHMKQ